MTAKDATAPEIAAFRRQIDAIDDQLAALLIERTGIVAKVGEVKRQSAPGQCPIRPGREAEMLRRIIGKFENTPFVPAAAAAIWRIIIGASTSVEGSLALSVYAAGKENDLFWLAREYFGAFAPVLKQIQVKRVIGDIIDGKAAVGIVPVPTSADTSGWWASLIQQGNDAPRIFARIPFVHLEAPTYDTPSALAIARIEPEPSGDDCSLLVLEAHQNASQHGLQTAFAAAKLEATWLSVATITPSSRHHLVEIRGFVAPGHAGVQSLIAGLGPSLLNVHFLGAYALPVSLSAQTKPARPGTHARTATKA